MGRYAFFDTGFEYKFGFGNQPSEDIELFGGKVTNIDAWNAEIVWREEELPPIKRTMKYLLFLNELQDFDVDQFDKKIQGTYMMYYELQKKFGANLCRKTLMCCLIYHQLLYAKHGILTCKYER